MSAQEELETSVVFPPMPTSGVVFPRSDIAVAAFAYSKKHTSAAVYNHAVRSAYWALILAKKHPSYNQDDPSVPRINLETVVLSCIFHDMGWSENPELVTKDIRFEVDGANVAKKFVQEYISSKNGAGFSCAGSEDLEKQWDARRIDAVWYAIALHTTASIGAHASPEIALVNAGIYADFQGPRMAPAGVISEAEYLEVVRAFPLAGFGQEGVKEIICGLCRDKPSTTYDNFTAGFGMRYGYDGRGGGKEEYTRLWEQNQPLDMLLRGLSYLENLVINQASKSD
ncbi:hypothetical protein S7711_06253 [Stachybotrys chartarum IBT 7711]|uniref:HD domain-containing protein n=1 Tax=Stachybotrys chartarum (strain CBS 109288 / IBT 7711) TaxID=1280523 RepID=A0A084B4Y8_STACB|nr:hypothetical protein S7711_06253 [Stachybotrys chartarum IBT 7711]